MDTNTIYQKAYELAKDIKNSDEFKKYLNLEKEFLNNRKCQELLNNFQTQKQKYEEATSYGSYYPGLDKIRSDYQKSKIELMNDNLFKEYKNAEKTIDLIISEIERELKALVNIKDKHGKSMIKHL